MIPWAQGRCLTWDVTSPDTFAASHLAESAVLAGSAAAKAEVAKTAKYMEIAITHAFVPLAFETLGAWWVQCQRFVSELGRRITFITGDTREATSGSASPSLCSEGMPSRAGEPCLMNWTIADFFYCFRIL